jgi:hypothetical protein
MTTVDEARDALLARQGRRENWHALDGRRDDFEARLDALIATVEARVRAEREGLVWGSRWKVYAKHLGDCIAQPPPVGTGEGCSCGLLALAREFALSESAALATPPAPEADR